jgi:hypothetical protein
MKRWQLTMVLAVNVAAAVCAAATAPGRSEITTEDVASALRKAGLPVSAPQVSLLSDISASSQNPALTVESIGQWNDGGIRARVACTQRTQCLPFFVSVRGVEKQAEAVKEPAQGKAPARDVVIRSGATATLLIDSQRVHISVPVVSLESGAVGQTIRVTERESRKIYRAQVIDGTKLRTKL